jgi:predicted small lipoprotein YifL
MNTSFRALLAVVSLVSVAGCATAGLDNGPAPSVPSPSLASHTPGKSYDEGATAEKAAEVRARHFDAIRATTRASKH